MSERLPRLTHDLSAADDLVRSALEGALSRRSRRRSQRYVRLRGPRRRLRPQGERRDRGLLAQYGCGWGYSSTWVRC